MSRIREEEEDCVNNAKLAGGVPDFLVVRNSCLIIKLIFTNKLVKIMKFTLLISDSSQSADELLHKTWSGMCFCWLFCGSVPVSKLLY